MPTLLHFRIANLQHHILCKLFQRGSSKPKKFTTSWFLMNPWCFLSINLTMVFFWYKTYLISMFFNCSFHINLLTCQHKWSDNAFSTFSSLTYTQPKSFVHFLYFCILTLLYTYILVRIVTIYTWPIYIYLEFVCLFVLHRVARRTFIHQKEVYS